MPENPDARTPNGSASGWRTEGSTHRSRFAIPQLLFGVAAEEGVGLPLRGCGAVGGIDQEAADDFLVEGSGFKVDRLVDVIRGRVVALCKPVFEKLLFGRVGRVENVHDDRRNAVE